MNGIETAEMLGVGRLAPGPDWHMPAHLHANHELIVVIRGRTRVHIAGRKILAGSGDVLFYPRKVAHEEWSDRNEPMETVFLSFQWEPGTGEIPLTARDNDGRIRELAAWLYSERDAHGPILPSLRNTFLRAIIAEYLRNTQVSTDSIVGSVRSFMREHLTEPVALADLAGKAGMSRFHFLRRYREAAGRTPMQDLRMMRLETARMLILSSSKPLKLIAPQVGFRDEYQLSRSFRKYLHMTPRELRRRV